MVIRPPVEFSFGMVKDMVILVNNSLYSYLASNEYFRLKQGLTVLWTPAAT